MAFLKMTDIKQEDLSDSSDIKEDLNDPSIKQKSSKYMITFKEDLSDSSDIKEDPSDPISIKQEDSNYTMTFKEDLSDSISAEDEPTTSSNVKQKIVRKKVMGSQARELIAYVYEHMKKEAKEGITNLKDARARTAQATRVSETTVTRILAEKKKADETGTPMRSPHSNKKPRKCIRRDISEEDKELIRNTIDNHQKEFLKPPSLINLRSMLKKLIGFNGCIETLRRLLDDVGYEFKTNKGTRSKVLVKKIVYTYVK